MICLKDDYKKSPKFHLVIVTLLAIGLISIPLDKIFGCLGLESSVCKMLFGLILRVILSVLAIVVIHKYGFANSFKNFNKKSAIFLLPAILVAVNNIPIIGIITGNVVITVNFDKIILFCFYCLSIGFYEELVFRGIVFPLCLYIFKNSKYSVLKSVILSSLMFAFAHFINIVGGAGLLETLLQFGYSFLIGGMCSIALLLSKNILVAIMLHAVYDFGGLMLGFIASGMQWDLLTIIITAVLGVVSAIILIIQLLKVKTNDANAIFSIGNV